MASWSKMAEAFGRAAQRPGARKSFEELEENAVRTGHEDEFFHGLLRGEDANTEINRLNRGNDLSERSQQKKFDEITDRQTDHALRDISFDQAFDEAEKGIRRLEPYDTRIKQELLEAIRQARENGIAESDILRQLKQLGRD